MHWLQPIQNTRNEHAGGALPGLAAGPYMKGKGKEKERGKEREKAREKERKRKGKGKGKGLFLKTY